MNRKTFAIREWSGESTASLLAQTINNLVMGVSHRRSLCKMLTGILLTTFTTVAFAKVCVWTGNGTPNPDASDNLVWTDPGNWEDGNVPVDGDTVSFTERNTTIHRIHKNLTLENLYYTNTLGTTFNGKSTHTLTLTGNDSRIVVGNGITATLRARVNLAAGARLSIETGNSSSAFNYNQPGKLTGSGEITKTGPGKIQMLDVDNSEFAGTWHIHDGSAAVFAAIDNAFGSSDSVVHLYNSSADARYGGTFNSTFFLHDSTFVTYRTATLNGDVTLIAESKNDYPFYLQGVRNATYYQESSPPGIVFNGNLNCDNTLYRCRPMFYAYFASASGVGTTFHATFNGTMDTGAKPIESLHKQAAIDRVIFHVNKPIVTTSSTGAILYGEDMVLCGVENAFGTRDIQFGQTKQNSAGIVFDMCGHDQNVNRIIYAETSGYSTTASITSSRGPALFKTNGHKNGGDQYPQTIPSLDGEASISFNKTPSVSASGTWTFSGGNTTGWIFTTYPGCDLTAAAFPNLGGIGLKGVGKVYVNATTALKNGVKFEFDSMSTGYLRVDTGVNIGAAQVIYDNVDVPAGTYCRTGAGVAGATDAAWLGESGYDGTVTIAAHNPSLIWTGAGDHTLLGAANWGANESPDLTDSSLTLDFRRATAEVPVILSGRFAPACVLTSGDISQGSPAFTGDGMLALSGSGVATNNFAFTGTASFEWNGPGTLCLVNPSDTSGKLTVNGGRVVIAAGSAWGGDVFVAQGAVLEVEGGRDGTAFSSNSKVALYGILELGDSVMEDVAELKVNGAIVGRDRTYGSSTSGALIADNAHFAGTGVIISRAIKGLKVIFR